MPRIQIFDSEKKRMRHTQARLVPKQIWKQIFNNCLKYDEILLMRTNPNEILNKLKILSPIDSEICKERRYISIVLAHPRAFENPYTIKELARALRMEKTQLLICESILGRSKVMIDIIRAFRGDKKGLLAGNDYYACICAGAYGHVDILKFFVENLLPDEKESMVQAHQYSMLRLAVFHGHLNVVQYLFDILTNDLVKSIIETDHYKVLNYTDTKRQMATVRFILKWFNLKIGFIESFNVFYRAYSYAIMYDRWTIFNDINKMLKPDDWQVLNAYDRYGNFRFAANHPKYNALKIILEKTSATHKPVMIGLDDFRAYRTAIHVFDKTCITLLLKHAVGDQRHRMVACDDHHAAFKIAADKSLFDLMDILLEESHYFAFAEENYLMPQFSEPVASFVHSKMGKLHERMHSYQSTNSQQGFNEVLGDEALLLYYFIRYWVRKNDVNALEKIQILVNIPNVISIVSTRLEELSFLSNQVGNVAFNQYFLALAHENPISHASVPELGLSAIVNNSESSMCSLTSAELARIQLACAKYGPIDNSTIPGIMLSLRQVLMDKYDANPAQILLSNDKRLQIPRTWEGFSELILKLSSEDNKRAHLALYQDKNHTALRFILEPNPWLSQEAMATPFEQTVYPNTIAFSSHFKEHEDIICVCYLAASDQSLPNAECTVEERLAWFINELAMLGRAHNWDETRFICDDDGAPKLNDNGEYMREEFDDGEADKPSCAKGIIPRLFQSVIMHPLFNFLTKQVLSNELRDMARSYFQTQINDSNRVQIKSAYQNVIVNLEGSRTEKIRLSKLLVNPEALKQKFIEKMSIKYPMQIEQDNFFKWMIDDFFNLKVQGGHDSYVSRWAGYVNFQSLLTEVKSQKSLVFSQKMGHARSSEPQIKRGSKRDNKNEIETANSNTMMHDGNDVNELDSGAEAVSRAPVKRRRINFR